MASIDTHATATATDPTDPPSKTDLKATFFAVFDDILNMVMAEIETEFDLSTESMAYIRNVVSYNVPHGKLNRGMAVFQCYKSFRSHVDITAQDEHRAHVLGWCVELLQAFFLVADDMMDDSQTRRGQPCYFRLPEIGLNAINDSFLLEMMVYRVLRIQFADDPAYPHLVALFRDISYTTEIGQMLDITNQKPGLVNFDNFTEDALTRIYKYKTSHYTFYLPVALGMRLAGVTDIAKYDTAKRICLKMGHYFQAQDDYIDAFGDPKVTGKVGTDIEEKTCTWLIVEALKVATLKERNLMEIHYGCKEKSSSDQVKNVYRKLKLPEAFKKFEQDSYSSLRTEIDGIDHMPVGAFEFLLAQIYKRDK